MKILIVLGHPNAGSFNHAIAGTVQEVLGRLGHDCWFHDLYAENFDPVVPAGELARDAQLPAAVQAHVHQATTADGIVVIHPNWWCQPPAILKGWVDRVLRPGQAYRFESDGKGGSRSVGLLKARTALVITTANTPQEKEIECYGDPLDIFWRKVVCGLCGIANCQRLIFTPVIVSSLEQRQGWLAAVQTKTAELFPR